MAQSALDHATEIITEIDSIEGAFEREPLIDERSDSSVFVRLTRRTSTGSRLAVSVLIDSSGGALEWLAYRFHYMDSNDEMVFRYDNTPHYGDLPGFPHHKHLRATEAVVDTDAPAIATIVREVKAHLGR